MVTTLEGRFPPPSDFCHKLRREKITDLLHYLLKMRSLETHRHLARFPTRGKTRTARICCTFRCAFLDWLEILGIAKRARKLVKQAPRDIMELFHVSLHMLVLVTGTLEAQKQCSTTCETEHQKPSRGINFTTSTFSSVVHSTPCCTRPPSVCSTVRWRQHSWI